MANTPKMLLAFVCPVLMTLIFIARWRPLQVTVPAMAGNNMSYNSCDTRTCGRLHDLTDDHPYRPSDTHPDMLDELRSCGLHPRLLSRAVRRDNDTTVNLVVPNVVHFILFAKNSKNKLKFQFQNYLSFRSAGQFMRPRYIFLHGDLVPEGEWWQRTLQDVDNLYHVYCEKPKKIHDRSISFVEHAADIKRLTLLIDFGGIYLDTDMLILKSLDPLRVHNLVLGRPVSISLSNGIMLARKGALFLRLWLENYRNYDRSDWGGNSVRFSNSLQKLFPHLVHVELNNMLRPNYLELEYLYGINNKFFDWSKSYSMHIYGENRYRVPETPEQLKGFNSTLGQVMRYIYFGSSDLLPINGKRFTAK